MNTATSTEMEISTCGLCNLAIATEVIADTPVCCKCAKEHRWLYKSGPILIPGGISNDDLIRAALSGQVDMMRNHQSFMGKPVADKETAKVSISTAVVTCGGHGGESGD